MDDKDLVAVAAHGDVFDVRELHTIFHTQVLGVQQHEGVASDNHHHGNSLKKIIKGLQDYNKTLGRARDPRANGALAK